MVSLSDPGPEGCPCCGDPGHVRYVHCKSCLTRKPAKVSSEEWARLSVALTPDGRIIVHCVRCDIHIVSFGGRP